jgi:carbonic anhydrase
VSQHNSLLSPALAGLCLSIGIATTASAGGGGHWGYSGAEGPEHWGELDAKFSVCAGGRNQSPIDLTNMVEGNLQPIEIDYRPGGTEVVNNGHTIQVNYQPGSTIKVDGQVFELKQFHFHSPSENTVEGHSYPMEAHFVHADEAGNLAVIAVMFEAGEENAALEKVWSRMPAHAGDKQALAEPVDAGRLLPHDRDYYRFNGSLTTPPCSEGVRWLVMKYYDTASEEQLHKFAHTMHHPNNRPVQPVNARLVVK